LRRQLHRRIAGAVESRLRRQLEAAKPVHRSMKQRRMILFAENCRRFFLIATTRQLLEVSFGISMVAQTAQRPTTLKVSEESRQRIARHELMPSRETRYRKI